jgi:hypothetical protein
MGDVFMLKKGAHRYIIHNIIYYIMAFTAVFLLPCAAAAADTNGTAGTAAPAVTAVTAGAPDDFEIKPVYIFVNKAGRDPFEPRYKTEAAPAMVDVDITTFSLQGITESKGMQAALFKSKSGNPFGYIFIDGRLYGENDRVIPDVSGEIRENQQVLLVQGDREVLFKLDEQLNGPDIRPDTK